MHSQLYRTLSYCRGTGALLAAVLLALPLMAEARDFSDPRNLSNNSTDDYSQHVAVSGTNVYAVWLGRDKQSGEIDVYFTRSDNSGKTFVAPSNLSKALGKSAFQPQIAARNGLVYVVWTDNETPRTNGPANRIWLTKSGDGGKTFSAPVDVSPGIESSMSPGLALDKATGYVYVVWQGSSRNENGGIYFRRSTDEGVTFSDMQKLSDTCWVDQPLIAVGDSGTVNVVWTQTLNGTTGNTMYRRSGDSGVSFDPARNLSTINSGFANPWQLKTYGNESVYVLWTHGARLEMASSQDGGASFSLPVTVGQLTDYLGGATLAIGPDGTVHVAWADDVADGPDAIYASHSLDGGATFSSPVSVGSSMPSIYSGNIAIGGTGSVFLVWEVRTTPDGNSDVFFAESLDGGATFVGQILSPTPKSRQVNNFWPEVSVSSNYVYVTWAGGPIWNQILFTRSRY